MKKLIIKIRSNIVKEVIASEIPCEDWLDHIVVACLRKDHPLYTSEVCDDGIYITGQKCYIISTDTTALNLLDRLLCDCYDEEEDEDPLSVWLCKQLEKNPLVATVEITPV